MTFSVSFSTVSLEDGLSVQLGQQGASLHFDESFSFLLTIREDNNLKPMRNYSGKIQLHLAILHDFCLKVIMTEDWAIFLRRLYMQWE